MPRENAAGILLKARSKIDGLPKSLNTRSISDRRLSRGHQRSAGAAGLASVLTESFVEESAIVILLLSRMPSFTGGDAYIEQSIAISVFDHHQITLAFVIRVSSD